MRTVTSNGQVPGQTRQVVSDRQIPSPRAIRRALEAAGVVDTSTAPDECEEVVVNVQEILEDGRATTMSAAIGMLATPA